MESMRRRVPGPRFLPPCCSARRRCARKLSGEAAAPDRRRRGRRRARPARPRARRQNSPSRWVSRSWSTTGRAPPRRAGRRHRRALAGRRVHATPPPRPRSMPFLPSLKRNLTHDPVRDFVPISRIASASNVLVINASLPVQSVAELVAPEEQTRSAQLCLPRDWFAGAPRRRDAQPAGGHQAHARSYKGSAPALLDVIAGSAQLIITSPISAGAAMKAGRCARSRLGSASATEPCPSCPRSPRRFPATKCPNPGGSSPRGHAGAGAKAAERRDPRRYEPAGGEGRWRGQRGPGRRIG